MRLILLGSPGAGKGTQAKLITERFSIPQISTGDILRAAIQKGSTLGKEVKEIVESGRLVPDEIVTQLVQERIKGPDCRSGFLLDGYPRTIAQAEALEQFSAIDYVIDIDVSDREIIERLSGRRIHPQSGRIYHIKHQPPHEAGKDDVTGEPLIQRKDDTEETVRKRLAVYHEQTSPLRNYYQQNKAVRYIKLDGTKPVDELKKTIHELLTQHKEVI